MHLADAFIQSFLSIHAIHIFCQYMCSLGIKPTTFALLTQCSNHWATGTHIHFPSEDSEESKKKHIVEQQYKMWEIINW